MKSGTSPLYPNQTVAERVSQYSEEHSTALPGHITELHSRVEQTHARANYMISNFQGQLHVFLARTIGARRVLEIGSYMGYSAMVWAHAVGPEGKVTGLEASEEYAARANEMFEEQGITNVEIIQGDALQTLPRLSSLQLAEPYDIIFIDAQKSGYPEYLRVILEQSAPGAGGARLLRAGGLIVADNVLRRGLVADDSEDNPWAGGPGQASEYETNRDLEAIREFNDAVVRSARLECVLLPLFDGVGLARLLD
ncbi:family 3 O-methyltransferase [Stachybotrys elegans]|uniref:Family 3 O-methyltransferase n=1 Tax=Stachybotrys elegans TaxID=80388 RepID=A0A8K0SH44_9HYPO|nr:family 3 O-methyltransferase [Stachybotrys elegans]